MEFNFAQSRLRENKSGEFFLHYIGPGFGEMFSWRKFLAIQYTDSLEQQIDEAGLIIGRNSELAKESERFSSSSELLSWNIVAVVSFIKPLFRFLRQAQLNLFSASFVCFVSQEKSPTRPSSACELDCSYQLAILLP